MKGTFTKKQVRLSQIYTNQFGGGRIVDTFLVDFVRELYVSPDKKIEDTGYFKWLQQQIVSNKEVWGWIKTDKDAKERVRELKDLIVSIEKYGYNEELNEEIFPGWAYGRLSVKQEGSRYKLIDGHHRCCVMCVLGYKFIEVEVYEQQKES